MMFASGCGAGAGCVIGAQVFWSRCRERAFWSVSDRNTGAQRRSYCPIDLDMSIDAPVGDYETELLSKATSTIERGFFTLKSGMNIFYQLTVPQGEPTAAVVLVHGYSDHCDYILGSRAKILASLGFAVASFDLPGHGRSDGEYIVIDKWVDFVEVARQIVADHIQPFLTARFGKLRCFGIGESLGGGLAFALQQLSAEKGLPKPFDGIVLVAPMLGISKNIYPPWIVVQIFKRILVPILPRWPVAPNKDIGDRCWENPAVHERVLTAASNTYLVHHGQPRLGTAYQMAFVAGEWMEERVKLFDTPLLLFHGAKDEVTDPDVSRRFFDDVASQDKDIRMPPNAWHADCLGGGIQGDDKRGEERRESWVLLTRWMRERA
ncbi:unnamed protein product [Prorocentrum cordatum]|uniref:Serine aminopeptidase S33 domain-containing protein n=1 Tax=Prorocentrum cordatum TaxID=2364126 RepID=A0ABN9WCI1_9DINO|nr:unnamed protein product [Polarella glacialis]